VKICPKKHISSAVCAVCFPAVIDLPLAGRILVFPPLVLQLSEWACGPQIVMKIGASFAPQYEVALPAEVVGAVGRLKPVRCLIRSMHLNKLVYASLSFRQRRYYVTVLNRSNACSAGTRQA